MKRAVKISVEQGEKTDLSAERSLFQKFENSISEIKLHDENRVEREHRIKNEMKVFT